MLLNFPYIDENDIKRARRKHYTRIYYKDYTEPLMRLDFGRPKEGYFIAFRVGDKFEKDIQLKPVKGVITTHSYDREIGKVVSLIAGDDPNSTQAS